MDWYQEQTAKNAHKFRKSRQLTAGLPLFPIAHSNIRNKTKKKSPCSGVGFELICVDVQGISD